MRAAEYRSSIASLRPRLQHTEYPSPSTSTVSLHAAADGVAGGAPALHDATGMSSLAGLFLLNTVLGDEEAADATELEADSPVGGFEIRSRNGDEGDDGVGEEADEPEAAEEEPWEGLR